MDEEKTYFIFVFIPLVLSYTLNLKFIRYIINEPYRYSGRSFVENTQTDMLPIYFKSVRITQLIFREGC